MGSSDASGRRRLSTVFGWVAGASLGVLASYVAFLVWGPDYPATLATFVLFVAGAFGGMALGDRLGERGFRLLGIVAGVLLALALTVMVTVALGGRTNP